MRTLAEYSFRAKQEISNLYLLLAAPQYTPVTETPLPLPDGEKVAAALRENNLSADIIDIANKLLEGRFPLLGVELSIGPEIHWRRDYQHGKESDVRYFRRLPYLDFEIVGDHKFVWELNRHQHFVLLAQAFELTGDGRYLDKILKQLDSWRRQNPFQRGINWTSALEVAFRVLSWIWVYHLVGRKMPEGPRRALLSGIYQHGLHLAANLSIYFSPNTHLLGEAVALFTIAACFPDMPGAAQWRVTSQSIVEAQLRAQVREDGSHFEQSTYYHVYAVDFFLWFYILNGRPKQFRPVLDKMAEYLFWTLGPARRISCLGDDDGGRLFFPFGKRKEFGRSTLSVCGLLLDRPEWIERKRELAECAVWWLGPDVLKSGADQPKTPQGSRFFKNSGSVFLQNETTFIHFDAGPFGFGGAGHSHADTLSFSLSYHGREVFIDPGTYTYISSPKERNWFRGTGAHNTVTVDGRDQADPVTLFRWADKPVNKLIGWKATATGGWLEAECIYFGRRHKRRLMLDGETAFVFDEIEADGTESAGGNEHVVRQWWHWNPNALELRTLSSSSPLQTVRSRFSPAYGALAHSEASVATVAGTLPLKIITAISDQPVSISMVEAENEWVRFRLHSAPKPPQTSGNL